ncbi:MAG: hypothetical protein R3E86_00045 [Pseudomonadales bacterium]
MKIRILDDSVRLRLDRDEVDAVGRGDDVCSATRFPGGQVLVCRLGVGGPAVSAGFAQGEISVRLPAAMAGAWALSDSEVSLSAQVPVRPGVLAILVEKDFECLAPREGENQSNRFPNPKA